MPTPSVKMRSCSKKASLIIVSTSMVASGVNRATMVFTEKTTPTLDGQCAEAVCRSLQANLGQQGGRVDHGRIRPTRS